MNVFYTCSAYGVLFWTDIEVGQLCKVRICSNFLRRMQEPVYR